MDRIDHEEAVTRLAVLDRLARFGPRLAGTPPLGLDLPGSDIDILCHAPDPAAFADAVWTAFAAHEGFAMRQWTGPRRPVIASFMAEGWVFELFGDDRPVEAQEGWRHFVIERRLLAIGGAALHAAVMAWRRRGYGTEPAFARVLGLAGDPYAALLDLGASSDEGLARRLSERGLAP
ncbi:DUF4269 domain-containing protein [Acuticoccus sp. M5D2P5]|uniref:DUF4269 domain-containing protein n=1 Tax=Acuticoccus kalidii TaxID=2910977 RepID=UPI001F466FB4|nr:DUF4269 domain-containing protein [Acuticoccus kalidii]MCF3931905.1 DUF4269 domain-containing protein [Acuticoccus kalidii]